MPTLLGVQTPLPLRRYLACAALLTLGATLATPRAAGAQLVVRTGAGSASLGVDIRVSLPVRLDILAIGAVQVRDTLPGFVEVELPVTVGANVDWSLRVEDLDGESSLLQVRDAEGVWIAFSDRRLPTVTDRASPTEPVAVAVRVRVPTTLTPVSAARLRFRLDPAGR